MKRVRVNPGTCEHGYRIVDDNVGRTIVYKEQGTEVALTTHISRALKCGDLVLVPVIKEDD